MAEKMWPLIELKGEIILLIENDDIISVQVKVKSFRPDTSGLLQFRVHEFSSPEKLSVLKIKNGTTDG